MKRDSTTHPTSPFSDTSGQQRHTNQCDASDARASGRSAYSDHRSTARDPERVRANVPERSASASCRVALRLSETPSPHVAWSNVPPAALLLIQTHAHSSPRRIFAASVVREL